MWYITIVYQDLVRWDLNSADFTFLPGWPERDYSVSPEWPTDTRNAASMPPSNNDALLSCDLDSWLGSRLSVSPEHMYRSILIGSDPSVIGRMQYSALTRPSMIILPTSYAVGRW
ncbi:hypothetical protein SCLCIDRAFT_589929 [Scleroderma citrinum Foug A]|uniref:Uncharacterized protein n=1 Tax=Scleroderma citrinum Foug A TaxID=1036808 RepID=A0A0C3E8M0_9AGAM|nr:hypothetical protein SCLCIDRAFT_589929 [Scleroderma citrinum Foug A]